jgi:hypothetical protein
MKFPYQMTSIEGVNRFVDIEPPRKIVRQCMKYKYVCFNLWNWFSRSTVVNT